jgi:hypothetical protein
MAKARFSILGAAGLIVGGAFLGSVNERDPHAIPDAAGNVEVVTGEAIRTGANLTQVAVDGAGQVLQTGAGAVAQPGGGQTGGTRVRIVPADEAADQ